MQLLRTRIACSLVFWLGCCALCIAETVTRVDLRRAAPQLDDYYIIICARESEPWGTGHAFVVWAEHDKRTGQIHSQGFGFYPEVERVVVRLFMGNGAIRDESTKPASTNSSLLTHRLIMQVDREVFEAALNVKQQWEESTIDYHLLSRNCTHFTYDVMRAIQPDVPRPELGQRPAAYVSRLMALDFEPTARIARVPATLVNARR